MGEVPGDNLQSRMLEFVNIKRNYNQFLSKQNLTPNILFLGFRKNIDTFYNNIDLLFFPVQINAVGRTIIEAAQFKVPSLTTNLNRIDLDICDKSNSFYIEKLNIEYAVRKIISLSKNRILLKKKGEKINRDLKIKNSISFNSKKLEELYLN